MRSEREIEQGIEAIESRIERDGESDHPLKGLVLAIHQAKRAGLHVVKESQHGEHWETRDNLEDSLTRDLGLGDYVQHQAMINALAWAEAETDSI